MMTKKYPFLLLFGMLLSVSANGEDADIVKTINPKCIYTLPRVSFKEMKRIAKDEKEMESLSNKLASMSDGANELWNHFYSYGCSWYCGGEIDTIYATSELAPNGKINYGAMKIHDFDPETAWVEGSAGDGIHEKVTYVFPGRCPRITTVLIMNGYCKTEKAWKNNGRVKRLKLYYDNVPFAILELADKRDIQMFDVGVLGFRDNSHPQWTLTFEILDVYPGEKYDDTAITELYFDGIDVH